MNQGLEAGGWRLEAEGWIKNLKQERPAGKWRAFLVRDLYHRLLFDVATGTVSLRIKSTFAVVTDTTKLVCVDLIHGDLYGSLLHFRKHALVMAVFALEALLFMYCSVEGDSAHRALLNSRVLLAETAKAAPVLKNRATTIR